MISFIKRHPYLNSVLLALILGFIICIPRFVITGLDLAGIVSMLMLAAAGGIFILYPLILTVLNLVFLFVYGKKREEGQKPNVFDGETWRRTGKNFEYITLVLGSTYSVLVLLFYEIQFQADWMEQLYNQQVHTPIYTVAYPTVIVFALVGAGGYGILSWVPLRKMPPLVIVCSISAMYLGMADSILWIIQIFSVGNLLLCLFPANCIVIAVKTIVYKIREWNEETHTEKCYKNPLLNRCAHLLGQAKTWPFAALLFMWPLLGVIICILVLFGQQPDAVIRAWTETSDWNLSKRTAPQNLYYDEHYLCTVAAGGHEKVVKPLRLGMRHGHEVIVNRQLLVANAFEQVLEERIPVFHRNIRRFYDTYGFPVAKMIHSPYTADFIYFLMKPLEWVFLGVLYFCDVNPENRIAVQYMPSVWNAH